ncbi:hypothetical protein Forpe1208_v014439 [Fusarium oxysporum f. sp. rapae]|uniref:Uncharacterized protein n=1 Tax=Fusarium oxysporum f. sp. rapae TaxID=485398 RepID=A0A8J5NSF8_FUSOX|nr:hypothetical protein Forpe1208_v014439 [Fusarium oxysporum f. sp. rapae]
MVKWNLTINRLNTAGFPYTELLDFLPDTSVDWQYDASQWNSSWKMSCEYIPLTELPIRAEWVTSTNILDQIPDIRSAFPSGAQEASSIPLREVAEPGGFFADQAYQDLLLFVLLSSSPSTNRSDTLRIYANNETMRITFLAFHLHNIPRGNDKFYFGIGPAEYSAYTRADCSIRRGRVLDPTHVTFLWTNDTQSIVKAFSDFHQANLVEQSIANKPIYHPTGLDLIRFFQAYMITKDTQFQHPVTRIISERQPHVRIALVTLSFFITYVIVLTMLLIWAFIMYPVEQGVFVPRTKVEWVMETVREVSARDISVANMDASRGQLCADMSNSNYGDFASPIGRHVGLRV